MAEPLADSIASEVITGATELLPPEMLNNLSLVLDLSKIALIVIILYFITWIISAITSAANSRKNYKLLKKISNTIEEINSKLKVPKSNKHRK